MEQLIPLNSDTNSITGLYAAELFGLTTFAVNELSDSDVLSFEKFYDELYLRAERWLQVDAQRILSGFYKFPDGTTINGKFNRNAKLSTQEASAYTIGNASLTPSIELRGYLSMYSSLVINWVEVFVNTVLVPTGSTDVTLTVTDNVTGQIIAEQLLTVTLRHGKNRMATNLYINGSYTDINVSVIVPITSPPVDIALTQQLFYANGTWLMKDLSCNCPLGGGYYMTVYQTEPGLNLQFTIVCDLARFIEYNASLFMYPLYYSIGKEFMKERIASDRINQYTVLTIERANQLLALYEADYMNSLMGLRDINSIPEDVNCFSCRKTVSSNNLLP